MDIFRVHNENGTMTDVPCCQFGISQTQQIMIIGTDLIERERIKVETGAPGVEAQPIGTLEEQNVIFEIQLTNSLKLENWDFQQYPNPEIILITDNRILN
jgi:hypothetical protein